MARADRFLRFAERKICPQMGLQCRTASDFEFCNELYGQKINAQKRLEMPFMAICRFFAKSLLRNGAVLL